MKRFVIVGASGRGYTMFARNLWQKHRDESEIVAICDPNPVRSEYYRANTFPNMKIYTDFELMLDTEVPDGVIVATVDRYHHEYIIKALERGYDVYSEKPMTIETEQCLSVIEAEKRSGKKVYVTFNCRFMPYYTKIKELVASGAIGRPLHMIYNYTLDTTHGADYFKRWHRHLVNSGGMMVHKATHHFDIANWVLDDDPKTVSATGARLFYGNDDRPHGERCTTCPYADTCISYEDYKSHRDINGLYFEAEHIDGYVRDHCAYSADTDIYDTMSVSVGYKGGAILSYSLTLYDTREGYDITIIGEKGAIQASTFFEGEDYKIILRHRDGSTEDIIFPKAEGTHSGGDDRLIDMLFGAGGDDPLGRCSGSFDGAKSALIGIAANQSIKDGERVDLTEVLDKMR